MAGAKMLLSVLDRLAVVALFTVKELLVMTVALRLVRQARACVSPGWVDFFGHREWQEPLFAPLETHFLHACYTDTDLSPNGVADMARYRAEDRIFGGVVVFDRHLGYKIYQRTDHKKECAISQSRILATSGIGGLGWW